LTLLNSKITIKISFITRIEEIAKVDYLPTVDDILYCRNKTTGIITEKFVVQKLPLIFVDVGGQSNFLIYFKEMKEENGYMHLILCLQLCL
jgi:hypothetical protein